MKTGGRKLGQIDSMSRCPECGKIRWRTRDEAKDARRRLRSKGLTIYRCGDFWHVGHVPPTVRLGLEARG